MSGGVKSTASILAIVAAIASFFVDNAGFKLGLAVVGAVLGVVGMLLAVSPRVKGGILSLMAVVIAAFGLIAAILDALGLF